MIPFVSGIHPVRVVLVRPRNPGNIGACARAMGNFGFTDLVVVDPYLPIWNETRSAPDAEEIVRSARKVATLKAAVRGCTRILGTSSFAHRNLEQAILPLPDLQAYRDHIKPHERIALIFGSERSGLSNLELASCEAVLQIPMARPRVSMNLAQAVAVVLYEWARAQKPASRAMETTPADKEKLIALWMGLAKKVGYPPGYTASARAGRIRQAMQNAQFPPDTARFLLSFSRWLWKKN
jgi:TrmH family RNA methyltransferase